MDKRSYLEEIEKNIKVCSKCRLCKTARNAVPGEGNPNSEIVFIGEAPGENEDLTGRPFVGRAGKLLESLLGKINYTREDVWIGNIIKHRPPQNRDPLPDEIIACQPFLTAQLKIMAPTLIVTLGRFALLYFYSDGKISRDRGSLVKTPSFHVFPVYHPAAALRNPQMARDLEEDFMRIPGVLKSIKEGKIKVKSNAVKEIVTYHDPCQVGRNGGFFEEPRYIVSSIAENFVDLNPNRTKAWCCGGGGGVVAMPELEEFRLKTGKIKAEQIKQSGASVIVSPCENCRLQLDSLNVKYELGLKIHSLMEFVADNLII